VKVRALRVSPIFTAWLLGACLAWAADLVDLNSAPVSAIAKLPGVGTKLARKIVEHRIYASMQELSKAGLSPDQIKRLTSVAMVKPAQNETPVGIGGRISQTIGAPGSQFPAAKKRVAVLSFDYSTVSPSVIQLFGSNQDIGKGIADMLVDNLVNSGAYSVIERKELDQLLAEQNFSNSDRADPASAAKIAKVLGVDCIIIGSITQFGRDDKSTGGGAMGGVAGRFGIGGASKSEAKAVVQITARMIDTSTAEILASVSDKGESTRKGTSLVGAGGSSGGAAGAGLDMRSSNFSTTIIGEATAKTVAELGRDLAAKAGSLPTVTLSISGMVAAAEPDGTVIINVGSRAGLKIGDTLNIKRHVRDITDPSTGKVLRSIESPVGTVNITEVDENSATGKFSGSGAPQVKDTVSNQ
jgi:curli biogenesis system outer membrane secretion channel CsgG